MYFTQGADTPPNYIFPMYSSQYCGSSNYPQLIPLLFRPLFWFGNNYRPTVDYSYSIGQKPVVSGRGKTYTIHLNHYVWSDGEPVTSRDIMFWMNLYKASPAMNSCGYVHGYFPDNVVSVTAPDPSTAVFTFNRAYDPEWVLYNELSQVTPIPLAWDRTSLSQPAPTSDAGNLPDARGRASAEAVYKFLDVQSKHVGTWASSPLWRVVDGPFRLQSFTSEGQVTLVPNADYSGSPKPKLARLVELPFTSEEAIFNQMRSGGPNAITVGNIPAQYAPQIRALEREGYVDNKAAYYGFNYFPMNFNSNARSRPGGGPFGYLVRQLYFRQAIQHLIDQTGWIHAFLGNTADPTYSPIPAAPPSPLVNAGAISTNPSPFSVAAAHQLLASHGWKVVPGGTTTCQNSSLCGPGIKKGEGISFNIDYASGSVAAQDEMNDLVAEASKVGIHVDLTTHPESSVIAAAVSCAMSQSTCHWSAENWGGGWVYSPDYLPTGESLFQPGSVANVGTYSDPTTTSLIAQTIVGSPAGESAALTTYAKNVEMNLPVVFGPTSIGTYQPDAGTAVDMHLGGYAANAFGLMNPENWYFVK